VLASIPTVLTTWLGLHFGKVLLHFPAHAYRIKHWAAFSVGLMTLGCIIHFLGDWKMNKQASLSPPPPPSHPYRI
jgi:heparan-alpha-glucosaminide N-acetyltransferase